MKTCPTCGTEYDDDAHFCARDRTPLNGDAGLTGQLLDGRYRVEARLATGGMGEVYRAVHVHIGRVSAIKVIGPGHATDPDSVGRFRREALHASRITHPNVCALYDFGVTPAGRPYLVMEYIEGVTLRQALEATPRFPPSRALAIARQCAAGLHAAHTLGIVHRDLKPDNILLTPAFSGPGTGDTASDVAGADSGDTVKLVDFGIAKAIHATSPSEITRDGLVLGTPEYMAPEQLAGDPVDARTDVYALALVCYRMITGALPFVGDTAQEALTRRLTHPPRPFAEAAPGLAVPGALEAVLRQGLAQRPQDRPPSVTAFVDALAAAVTAVHEAPTVRLARVPSPGSRRRLVVGVAVATALAAVSIWALVRPGSLTDGRGDTAVMRGATTATDNDTPGDTAAGSTATVPPALDQSTPPATAPMTRRSTDPALPSPDSITSADPAVRERARVQNQQLSNDTTLSPKLRASAAFGLAEEARLRGRIGDRIHYLELALRLNPTQRRYRDLLARARQSTDSISL